MSGLGNHLPRAVDEDPERHVALNFLRKKRRRVAKRQFLVEHHRSHVRWSSYSLKRTGRSVTGFLAASDDQRQNQQRPLSFHHWKSTGTVLDGREERAV